MITIVCRRILLLPNETIAVHSWRKATPISFHDYLIWANDFQFLPAFCCILSSHRFYGLSTHCLFGFFWSPYCYSVSSVFIALSTNVATHYHFNLAIHSATSVFLVVFESFHCTPYLSRTAQHCWLHRSLQCSQFVCILFCKCLILHKFMFNPILFTK